MNNWDFNYNFMQAPVYTRMFSKKRELAGKIECSMLDHGYRISGHCHPALERGEYYRIEIANAVTNPGAVVIDYVCIDEEALEVLLRNYVVKVMHTNSCSFIGMPLRKLTQVEKLVSGFLKEEK